MRKQLPVFDKASVPLHFSCFLSDMLFKKGKWSREKIPRRYNSCTAITKPAYSTQRNKDDTQITRNKTLVLGCKTLCTCCKHGISKCDPAHL